MVITASCAPDPTSIIRREKGSGNIAYTDLSRFRNVARPISCRSPLLKWAPRHNYTHYAIYSCMSTNWRDVGNYCIPLGQLAVHDVTRPISLRIIEMGSGAQDCIMTLEPLDLIRSYVATYCTGCFLPIGGSDVGGRIVIGPVHIILKRITKCMFHRSSLHSFTAEPGVHCTTFTRFSFEEGISRVVALLGLTSLEERIW